MGGGNNRQRRTARGAQRASASGRAPRAGAAAGAGRCGVGQDACAHAPDRPADPHWQGAARRDPGHHLHEQGRAGDARARRDAGRAADARDVGHDVPLSLRSVNLFELFPDVRKRCSNQFRQILVDEYQDTNRTQYRFLELLAEEHRNLMVVGDEDQSVYRFRGADIRNILDFQKDFPDAEVIRLEQNYRSTQPILSVANAIIQNNRERLGKNLWTDKDKGDLPILRELEDEHNEARYVAGEIERLVDEGMSRDEVAVFYRTNAQSRGLEDTLVRYGVSYQVIGGTKSYDRAEIKDALAYLTFLTNPSDAVAFGRIVNST